MPVRATAFARRHGLESQLKILKTQSLSARLSILESRYDGTPRPVATPPPIGAPVASVRIRLLRRPNARCSDSKRRPPVAPGAGPAKANADRPPAGSASDRRALCMRFLGVADVSAPCHQHRCLGTRVACVAPCAADRLPPIHAALTPVPVRLHGRDHPRLPRRGPHGNSVRDTAP